MSKLKVKDLSTELGLNNKDMLQVLKDLGIQVRSFMTSLSDEEVEQIRTRAQGGQTAPVATEVTRRETASGVIVRRRKRVESEPAAEGAVEASPAAQEAPAAQPVTPPAAPTPEAPRNARIIRPEPAPTVEAVPATPAAAEVPTAPATPVAAAPVEPAAPETEPVEEFPVETVAQEEVSEPSPAAEAVEAPGEEAAAAPVAGTAEAEEESEQDRRRRKGKRTPPPAPPQVRVISRPEIVTPPPAPPAPAGRPAPSDQRPRPAGPGREGPAGRGFEPRPGQAPAPATAESEADKKKGKRDKRVVEFAPSGDNEEERRKAALQARKKKTVEVKDRTGGKARPKKGRRGRDDEYQAGGRGGYAQAAPLTTQPIKAAKRKIRIEDFIRVSDMAHQMGVKAPEVIKVLLGMGIMATINQTLDFDTATLVASEFEYEVEKFGFSETEYLAEIQTDQPETQKPRPPVVTIMGHVDHGKTSLLDAIRMTNVTAGEAGGITQHIGAYHVTTPRGVITFLDTPGHEAFTAMRARGAQVTDLVILVVAADDGVMDQTREAVNHSKAAGVPIVVAVNKIDKENADPDRVKRELSDLGMVPEEWGGDTMFVHVSAKQRLGLDELLETVLLQAEVLELKANPDKRARGHIVEAKLDKGRGPVATLLVQEGTLHQGDVFVCGVFYGKVRALFNDQGRKIKEAGPAIPVEVQGFDGVPEAGDEFFGVEDEKVARRIADARLLKHRERTLASGSKVTLESFLAAKAGEETKILNLVVKSDVQGSLEAIIEALNKLSTEAVKVQVIHGGAGAITESDIMLAAASQAIIIGFNVRPIAKVKEMAEREKVDIRFYDIIYKLVSEIKDAMSGMLAPIMTEVYLGQAEVRQTFSVPRIGTVAGCAVMDGKLTRNAGIRLLRNGVVTYTGKLTSLKRFKDDVKEVLKGYECGVGLENFNDIKVGDIIEAFEEVAQKQTLA